MEVVAMRGLCGMAMRAMLARTLPTRVSHTAPRIVVATSHCVRAHTTSIESRGAMVRSDWGYGLAACAGPRRSLSLARPSMTPEIEIAELTELINSQKPFVLIDVREGHETKQGMIPTAKNIPLGEIPKAVAMPPKEFERKYGFPKPAKNAPIVLYCRAGVRSEQAAHVFLHAGFKATRNYKGSWHEWSLENREKR